MTNRPSVHMGRSVAPKGRTSSQALAGGPSRPPATGSSPALPNDTPPVVLAPHEARRRDGKALATRIIETFLDFAELAAVIIQEKDWERFKDIQGHLYESADAYFQGEFDTSHRTMRRFLAAREGLLRLPEGERQEARTALVKLGSHKAGALAPLIGKDGQDWRKWIEQAEQLTVPAVQAAVTEATGARRRGAAASSVPGDPFVEHIDAIFEMLPSERRERAEAIWAAFMRHYEFSHPIAGFLMTLEAANEQLIALGKGIE